MGDSLTRRRFLAQSGAGAAALALPLLAHAEPGPSGAGADGDRPRAAARYPIGIEMYAVRGELARDLPKTLRTVSQIGYEVVEFYAPYLEWTVPYAKTVKTMLDDLGLRAFSTHNGAGALTAGAQMSKAIEMNQILGTRQLIVASPPFTNATVDDWKRLAADLTAASRILAPHGLFAGFHNHDTEWAPIGNGQRGMDVIAANTPAEFVLQLDVGTCVKAGADPVAWVRSHPGRIRSVHLKDWAPGSESQEKSYRVLFGEGSTPWRPLMAALESVGGVEFYLMEQEGSRYSEFDTARRCLATWRRMRAGR